MSPRPYELLVFDWDGTLIDSIGSIVACTQTTLAELGLEPLPDLAIRQTIGLGLKETLEALLPDASRELANQIRETYFHHWLTTYCHQPILFPDVEPTLQRLAGEGYVMAVATGKSRRGLERDMARIGLREYFATTRTVDEAPSKPSPQMLLDVLDDLGMHARTTLMIGDTTHDLHMARAAGVAAVAVTGGSQTRQTLAEAEPLDLLGSVLDLPEWLALRTAHALLPR
ncbi:MAG: HAD-IA family hydrolase [Acidobacteria bacterium]|nr:HAD-IA family hydrolase [Acidobacteriota bacterium]